MEVRPLSGALGAEIFGIDLSVPLSAKALSFIECAFQDYGVIFFRDQELNPDLLKAFGKNFGNLIIHPYLEGLEGNPEIMTVKKEPHETINFANGWHTDSTYQSNPSFASILYAVTVPDFGGDTLFANMYLAYETLSPGMRDMLDGLTAQHSFSGRQGLGGSGREQDFKYSNNNLEDDPTINTTVEHPVVLVNPQTSRKSLYVNSMFTTTFKNMTIEESAPLLDYLFQFCVRPELTCRFRWEKGSIAFWDNRYTQHYPINDYSGQFRLMYRLTLKEN